MRGEPAVERAPAQSQRFGRLAHVSVVAGERLLDENALCFLERQLLVSRRRALRARTQREVGSANGVTLGQEHGALDRMVELADVAGPRMIKQRLHRRRVEAAERFLIARGVSLEEVDGEGRDVLAPLAD